MLSTKYDKAFWVKVEETFGDSFTFLKPPIIEIPLGSFRSRSCDSDGQTRFKGENSDHSLFTTEDGSLLVRVN